MSDVQLVRPKPVPMHVKCSICDLPWSDHLQTANGNKDDSEVNSWDCIRVLKAELAKRPQARGMLNVPQWPDVLGNGEVGLGG